MSAAIRPVSERIGLLDVLRGAALLGILLFNIDSLSGHDFAWLARGPTPALAHADPVTSFLIVAFIEGKFYSLFSMLFGIGFAVILRRCQERDVDPARYLRRRYLWLLLIGLVHTFLIWYGDILVLYGLLGLVLIVFRKVSIKSLLFWSIGCLLAPIVLYGGAYLVPSAPPAGGGGFPPALAHAVEAFRAGNYAQVVVGNAAFTGANAFRRLVLMFYPRVFGMFLLGVAFGRLGVFEHPQDHSRLLKRLMVLGACVGLPLGVLFAVLDPHRGFLPLTSLGWLRTALDSIGTPMLTLLYAAAITTAYRNKLGAVLLKSLAPVGQMALSNYLLQSVCGIAVFYGMAGGLYMTLSLTAAELAALTFFALQILSSRLWMQHFAFGPVEWLWRQLTYGIRLPIRRLPTAYKSRSGT
jgi:uncharacterized protein